MEAKRPISVTTWIEATDETLLYLSVLTLGEIRRGVMGFYNIRLDIYGCPADTALAHSPTHI